MYQPTLTKNSLNFQINEVMFNLAQNGIFVRLRKDL